MNIRLTALALSLALAHFGAAAQLKAPRNAAAPAAQTASAPQSAASAAESNPAHAEMEAAAQLAAAAWLSLLDARDWGRAWEGSSAVFRSSVPLNAWMDGIPKLRDPLGKFIERAPAGAQYRDVLEGRPRGDYVTVAFDSRFAAKEDLEELVTLVREPDGKWRVTGYQTR